MSTRLSDYDYELPAELIASRPVPERDASRMLVLERASGRVTHARVSDLPSFLSAGDLAVFNNSRVIRARIPVGENGEIFLIEPLKVMTNDQRLMTNETARIEGAKIPLKPISHSSLVTSHYWKCLVRPGRKFRVGTRIALDGCEAHVTALHDDGCREIVFDRPPDLDKIGTIPIPPYFHREADAQDTVRYQTVFASEDGSVAAPTAGLHFTPQLLSKIPHTFLTLHVGIGTFLPVKTESLDDHKMHEERYTIPAKTAVSCNTAKRILAVGTTTVRVLESQPPGPLQTATGATSIFIRPPYEFQRVGALLTNFHLPCSTLLALVSAFAGRELILDTYRLAIAARYRFYSYGDCMLII